MWPQVWKIYRILGNHDSASILIQHTVVWKYFIISKFSRLRYIKSFAFLVINYSETPINELSWTVDNHFMIDVAPDHPIFCSAYVMQKINTL